MLSLVASVLAGPVGVSTPARPVDWAATAFTAVVCVLVVGGLARHATRPFDSQEDS